MSEIFNLLTWPALVKVLTCFGLVVAASRLKVNLGLCLIGAGLLLGLWMGIKPAALIVATGKALTAPWSVRLALLVIMILVLSHLMKEAGQLERIVELFSTLVRSPKVVAAVMPALIGLLPMPGGALFSAPMVEASCRSGDNGDHQRTLMATINYWFRHHGEYWWPLYPGFILCVALLRVDMALFILVLLPLVVVHFLGGAWFLVRPLQAPPARRDIRPQPWAFLKACAPIVIVVLAVPLLGMAAALWRAWSGGPPPWPEGTPLILGLAAAIVQTVAANHMPPRQVLHAALRRDALGMVILVAGIMIFQGLMQGSGAVKAIQAELSHYGIPALAMIIILPFISGLVTGIAIAYVAASFPLVVPLFAHLSGASYLAYGGLAFVCGYFGMMLSPLHLCFLLSKDYFNCSLSSCYPSMMGPLVASAAALAVWFLILS